MTIKRASAAIFTVLVMGTSVSGCADTTTASQATPAEIIYDRSKPAAFSLNADCSTTDVIFYPTPNSYVMQDGKMCEWAYGRLCIQDGVIVGRDDYKKPGLTRLGGAQYTMTQTDGTADKTLTLCDADYQNAPVMWGAETEPNNRDDYDFEQSYQKFCDDDICYGSGKRYQKYSDYSADVLAPLNLSTALQSRKVWSHLTEVYAGRVKQSSFNNRKHPTDTLLTFHLMPQGNAALDEYILYVRIDGDGGFDKVKDWGGRVKCAPTKTDAPFQKTPCP